MIWQVYFGCIVLGIRVEFVKVVALSNVYSLGSIGIIQNMIDFFAFVGMRKSWYACPNSSDGLHRCLWHSSNALASASWSSCEGTLQLLQDGTPPNPSTIDVMVGSPSKKQTRARDMLQSLGNLFLVRLVIYNEFERV